MNRIINDADLVMEDAVRGYLKARSDPDDALVEVNGIGS